MAVEHYLFLALDFCLNPVMPLSTGAMGYIPSTWAKALSRMHNGRDTCLEPMK